MSERRTWPRAPTLLLWALPMWTLLLAGGLATAAPAHAGEPSAGSTTTTAQVSAPRSSSTKWTDVAGTVIGSVSALAVIVGAALAYRRFVRERPYFARAELSVRADLFTVGEVDIVRVRTTANAIGKARLNLVPPEAASPGPAAAVVPSPGAAVAPSPGGSTLSQALYPNFAVLQALTTSMVADMVVNGSGPDWTQHRLARADILVSRNMESGESFDHVLLFAVERPVELVAYRVEVRIQARDPEEGQPPAWKAAAIVPVAMVSVGRAEDDGET